MVAHTSPNEQQVYGPCVEDWIPPIVKFAISGKRYLCSKCGETTGKSQYYKKHANGNCCDESAAAKTKIRPRLFQKNSNIKTVTNKVNESNFETSSSFADSQNNSSNINSDVGDEDDDDRHESLLLDDIF